MKDVPSVVIVGQGALSGADGPSVLAHAMALAEGTNSKFMVLHTAAGRVGAMDVGACTEGGITAALDGADVIYNLGADEVEIAHGPCDLSGSHEIMETRRILPVAVYTEENGSRNTEGVLS